MTSEATKEHLSHETNNNESNGVDDSKKKEEFAQKLKDLDDLSYASSLSSTPILKLKSPKSSKRNKSDVTTKTSTKKAKTLFNKSDKAETMAFDSKKKPNSKNSKVKKSHSVNGKSSSCDDKSKSKSSVKSPLLSIPEQNAVSTDQPQSNNCAETKSPSRKRVSPKSGVTDSLSGEHVPSHIAVAAKTVSTKSDVTTGTAKSSAETGNPAKKSGEIKATNDKVEGGSEDEEEEEAACYLCHCGVDCSDRALFFPKDRKKEIQESDEDQEYYFGMDDPYLSQEMYDPHNALVYCDSCDRMYHQKCHFVPILKLPQGDWNCLICNIKANKMASCLPAPHDPKTFFASPPNPSFAQSERKFEFDSKTEKAKLWQKQLKAVKTFLSSQVSNIRLAKAALDTLTSTKRNRAMILSNRRKSQELAQTLLRMTTAKFKIRQTLLSLESLRVSPCTNSLDPTKVKVWCQEHPKHACHVVPHGINYFLNHRRVTPRTAEMKLDQERKKEKAAAAKDAIPSEILCSPKKGGESFGAGSGDGDKNLNGSSAKMEETKESTSKDDDNDSGITLDDLQCCICMVGDSTDDNDVILCDGEGCYRAFHMKCIHPEIKPQDLENEDEDWFCPLCTATSTYTHGIYDALREGEEDDSDEEDEEEEKEKDEDEWDTPDDAFPNSQWEYETAVKFSQGKQNEDTNELLALYLGDEVVGTKKVTNPIGSDSEDENDYSLFDEESFAERKNKDEEKDQDEEDDSDRSSQATWLSSSVEMNIGKDELNALSEGEESDSDEGSSASGSNTRRRSRRLRSTGDVDQGQLQIGVDFDEGNIIEGKRRRKTVDYIKLNDALFGKMTEKQKATLDDGADYKTKKGKKRKSTGNNGNKKKKAKPKNAPDTPNEEKSGEDSTTTKQSESPSKGGTEDASESNSGRGEADDNDDSDNNDGSGSENESGSDDGSNSGSDNDSGSENDSDSDNGSDSNDDDED